jgi:hypothetical protein
MCRMGWRALIGDREVLVAPWVGGRSLHRGARVWSLHGELPGEHGWFRFEVGPGRKATCAGPAEPEPSVLLGWARGYLAGDRFFGEDEDLPLARPVRLVEPGLERFSRVLVGSALEGGPLIFGRLELPLGPESEVLRAFLDRRASLDAVRGVPPALDLAFRTESRRRDEADERRRELERKRRVAEQLGDGALRRELARTDFGEAARAALALGGAEYLDHRARRGGEWVVQFRFLDRRFECITDGALRVVDAGICLTDHRTGVRGDGLFTLESLPAVIREADRRGVLVVFRHME